jgi:hypothetical protein
MTVLPLTLDIIQYGQGCPLCIELYLFSSISCQSYHIHLVDPAICLLRPDPTKEKRLPPFTVKTSSRTSQGETNILHADSGCAYTNGLHIWYTTNSRISA